MESFALTVFLMEVARCVEEKSIITESSGLENRSSGLMSRIPMPHWPDMVSNVKWPCVDFMSLTRRGHSSLVPMGLSHYGLNSRITDISLWSSVLFPCYPCSIACMSGLRTGIMVAAAVRVSVFQ